MNKPMRYGNHNKTMRLSDLEYKMIIEYRKAHSDKQETILDILHIDYTDQKGMGKIYDYKRGDHERI